MRISRHAVGAERLRAATEDFPARLSRRVDHQRHAGRASGGWATIAAELLDYAGARSVERPYLDRDTRMAVYSAAEAYLGVVALDGYSPRMPARVVLSYVNTTVSYAPDPAGERDATTRVAAADWMAALSLAVIVGAESTHGVTLLETTSAASLSPAERAFACHVLGEPANRRITSEEPGHPLALLGGSPTSDEPAFTTALRALAIRDRDGFWRALGAMLAAHRDSHGPHSPPRSLLPLAPIALAALAARDRGWDLAVESDYLPARLVTGGATGGRARPAPTLARPAVVERPPLAVSERHLAFLDEGTAEDVERAVSPRVRLDMLPQALAWTMGQQLHRFQLRSARDPKGHDPRQREAVAIASQSGAAIFRAATAPDDHVEVTIGHVTAPLRRTGHTPHVNGLHWRRAVCAALVADDAHSLDALVALDPELLAGERTTGAYRYYRDALHIYLSGADATAAVDRALWARERDAVATPEVLTPPAALLSRLVAGDPDGFALTLVEELEEHRDHFSFGPNAGDPTQLVNLDILALARHATVKGWPLPVRSDYLPEALLTRRAGLVEGAVSYRDTGPLS
ncbi:immunity 49 family protein [Halostreptopolyspora alba]|uniref:Immunity 49 family protein n=1 Tax=Halostreptopolyspora alba TaxID=2487137 RepID=A0A3N0ED01_9ACTN|nr:hypothetical protein EFW17_06965 [Nocardiopsaceae bacterium YIM 96095]